MKVTGKGNQKDDLFHIDKFLNTGKFLPGTIFSRSTTRQKNNKGVISYPYWNYKCPKCSHDEFVEHGLCSGVFEGECQKLKLGKRNCRCAPTYRWTQEQREYQIQKEIDERGLENYFIGWVDPEGYKNNGSKIIIGCINSDDDGTQHKSYTIAINDFLHGHKGCAKCAGQTQKHAYINVVYNENKPVAIKFGIANAPHIRIEFQNSKNLYKMVQPHIYKFFSTEQCKDAERYCKSIYKNVLTKEQLFDGYTETTLLENIENIIQIYEKYGGIRTK
ncbi:hypothetical protein RaK2_00488 [Klebsiella phage vB_KleM_RaK2]|uniref:CapR homology domain-containing protein n=1 Tax=Klebsiella phage vB_KleM_RaK2 TaxID=1147094 RepID=H6X4U5_9CAUD|nr:endonuclease [Klebsiella phage vB_KleM_RaK2]AFA44761.1 hypothetical protein RaK2_00488 [Klebsiella phage vB_KleM_RaK2]